ncbi:MAG: hypothetical protein H6737_05280 [Alphaproteobacteria bacterium]|nr:hypothetical protein [Alphaproteobacteria bacterium]
MIPDWLGDAPVLVARAPRPRGTLLLLHGQYADALTNAKELALIRGAGWNAVGVDAPDHGRRFDEGREARWNADQHAALEAHVKQASEEIPGVLDGCEAAGLGGPFGIVGISLGAFTLWSALALEPRLRVAVPILGSPVMPGRSAPDPSKWHGCRVLAQNAEHDAVVPIEPTRHVVDGIDGELHVIPGSPHTVPELQWWEVWGRALSWFDAHLAR